jgi:SAM-dependent methyltransferase
VYECYSEDYYEANSATSKDRKGSPSYREEYETLTASFRNKLEIVMQFVTGGVLLDAGAAYGYFLKVLPTVFHGQGLEISEYACRVAREQTLVNVQTGDIANAPFGDNIFDAVVMWDIIEHIIFPRKALEEVFRILKPGAYCFISTDDAGCWLPRLLGRRWWALAAPLHLCHFSKKGIVSAAVAIGFTPPRFFSDPRKYSISEIVKHFGVSYKKKTLIKIGDYFSETWIGKRSITVTRPEQFVAVLQKPMVKEHENTSSNSCI